MQAQRKPIYKFYNIRTDKNSVITECIIPPALARLEALNSKQ